MQPQRNIDALYCSYQNEGGKTKNQTKYSKQMPWMKCSKFLQHTFGTLVTKIIHLKYTLFLKMGIITT
jgi:hypothetical protein